MNTPSTTGQQASPTPTSTAGAELTDREIEDLGDEHGKGTRLDNETFLWFDGSSIDYVRACIAAARAKL
jgi:hypothetical protein